MVVSTWVPSTIKNIFFDLGSTLIYSDAPWPDVMERSTRKLVEALKIRGYALDGRRFECEFTERMEEYYRERDAEYIEHTTAYLLDNLLAESGYPDVPESHLRQALADMYAVSQAHWQLEEDAFSTLQRLKKQGYRLGLISNAADDADVQTLIDRHDLRHFFELILVSAAVGLRKPHPYIFQIALDHWEADPRQTAMVGDTLGADILGANRLGIASIWITRRADTPENRDHEATIRPTAVISALEELPDLLLELPG